MKRLLVDDLIQQVRSMLDEDNRESIKDDEDILPALNRAQDFAVDILARQYPDPLLANVMIPLTSTTALYDIPEDALEQRLEKVEIQVQSGWFTEVQRVSYRDSSQYESTNSVPVPYHYCIIGNQFRMLPLPSGTYSARIWYLKDPESLEKNQGRITTLNSASNYVLVNEVGGLVTTDLSDENSFVSIVDGESGVIKGALQVQSINGQRITFKTVPSQATVYGRTVLAAIPSDVTVGDYLAITGTTCIPFMKKPLSNFYIQYAVAELTRKLGGAADMEMRVLDDLKEQVTHSWVARETTTRVKNRSKQWTFSSKYIP